MADSSVSNRLCSSRIERLSGVMGEHSQKTLPLSRGYSRFNPALIPPPLRPIADKVQAGVRVSDEEAVQLYKSNELNAIGAIANIIRERKNGNIATYILNRYINY